MVSRRVELMAQSLSIQIFRGDNIRGRVEWDSPLPLVLGRQDQKDDSLLAIQNRGDFLHLPFTSRDRVDVSRRQVQLERIDAHRVRITNLNPQHSLGVEPDVQLDERQPALPFVLPVTFGICGYRFRLEGSLQTLSQQTQFYSQIPAERLKTVSAAKADLNEDQAGELVLFLSRVTSVLQQSTSEQDLYRSACEAVRTLIDVDAVAVVWGQQWETRFGDPAVRPGHDMLNRLRRERRVLWGEQANQSNLLGGSRVATSSFLAAPIVTEVGGKQEVGGAIVAQRDAGAGATPEVSALQAQLLELVACTVAAGLVRIQQQHAAHRFEQFFTPALAKKLVLGDELLRATQCEVTILFCDIRRFSLISEQIGPQQTSRWVQDVLSTLSDCVLRHEGVLVDYIGDELMAMWGAPERQSNHAELACRAALEMIQSLPVINEKWKPQIHEETHVGIGINSGLANVGNTGSSQKFKYGPLGDSVNRASRVQGLTKYLKIDVLLTGETRRQLPDDFLIRRIGNASVVNIEEPIELYELQTDSGQVRPEKERFEQALLSLEQGQLAAAAELLKTSLDFHQPDHPTLLMLSEIIRRFVAGAKDRDFQWEFGRK